MNIDPVSFFLTVLASAAFIGVIVLFLIKMGFSETEEKEQEYTYVSNFELDESSDNACRPIYRDPKTGRFTKPGTPGAVRV